MRQNHYSSSRTCVTLVQREPAVRASMRLEVTHMIAGISLVGAMAGLGAAATAVTVVLVDGAFRFFGL